MSFVRKETQSEFLLRMVKLYPKVFRTDNKVLYCVCCNTTVLGAKKFQIDQHLSGKKHKIFEEKQAKKSQSANVQTLVTNFQNTPGPKLSEFNIDLCQMLLETNTPLYRVNHPSFVSFIEKYTQHTVPTDTSLRQKYVPHLHEKMLNDLQLKADGKQIWVALDETTDVDQRMVANFVFGILGDENERGKSYLLNAQRLEKTNANTVATFFTDSLLLLWPNGKYSKYFRHYMFL